MPILPDDPRLTAYALGELDVHEREQIEAELSDSPEGQRAVDEIRATAALLRRELAQEAAPVADENRLARLVGTVIGTAAGATSATAGATTIDAQPFASVAPERVNHAHWAGSPLAASIESSGFSGRRFAAMALAASLLVCAGVALVLPAMEGAREAARKSVASNNLKQIGGAVHEYNDTNNPVPQAAESFATPGFVDALSDANSQRFNIRNNTVYDTNRGPTKEIMYTVVKPIYASDGQKVIAYTVCKPVYETKTKSIAYTLNGKTMRKEVPYTVTNSESVVQETQNGRMMLGVGANDQNRTSSLMMMVTPRVVVQEEDDKILLTEGVAFHDRRVKEVSDALVQKQKELASSLNQSPERANQLATEISKLQQSLAAAQQAETEHYTEAYARIVENAFLGVLENPLSTFSIDVDTASYANMRRFLNQGTLPPPDAVRIEELLNYFTYDYEPSTDDKPFAVHSEVAACPWNGEHRLVRIGIKGKVIDSDKRPASNLVFLIDVSGSMDQPNKLPLLKSGLKLLVDKLGENDRVAIVVYAGASGLVLDSITGDHKESITASIEQLQPGGSTNGASGIELAYQQAVKHFIKGGTNRVILCTDGDFNVGVTNEGDLTRLIEDKAKSGVFLSVLGFGEGNLKDATMEKLADKGNGNYGYIDTINEARKNLVEQMSGTLVTIAKDVKIQIEFNPAQVGAYRLIGYENRMLAKEDFNDDTKDAGEIGAGHTVTALYEIVPAGKPVETPKVDDLKYQQAGKLSDAAASGDLLTLKLRYKAPEGSQSTPLEFPLKDSGADFGKASGDFKFAAAVASFGMLLRQSQHKGSATLDGVLEIAESSKGADAAGYRGEFIELVKKAKQIGAK